MSQPLPTEDFKWEDPNYNWRDPPENTRTTTTTTVYFNEVVFPSVLGLTSPLAFPQHSPPPSPVPSIFPYKVPSFSYLLSTLLSISSWAYLSLHHHLPAVSQFSLYNTTHTTSLNMTQTTSTCFVASLQQHHQLPARFSHTHYCYFHLNSLLSSISTSSFHSSAFSLYPLSLLAMSHYHTTLQVLCMLYK